jgi:HAD superfamily hydrolase (TIGR01509 family)
MVLGVPHDAEPPMPAPRGIARRPVDAVLFDFHGTLAQVRSPVDQVLAAAAECGTTLERARATMLADRLAMVGLCGGPLPTRVPPHLAEVWAERDLYPHAHRAAYTGLAAQVDCGVDGMPDALYERLLRPEGWQPYADAAPTLRALHEGGIPVGVVSNIGFDIRPMFAAWGLEALVKDWTLSYEVGRCKPDPSIFLRACSALGADPERTLMVGDTPADAAAVGAGCVALVLPASGPGAVNGLAGALLLAGMAG